MHGVDQVFAFEPYPPNAEFLRKHFSSTPSVKVFEFALGSRDHGSTLHIAQDQAGNVYSYYPSLHVFENTDGVLWSGHIPVECRSLSSLIEEGVVPQHVGILKIDTEGNDYDVLLGMGNLRSDLIMVEYWDDVATQGPCPFLLSSVVDELRQRGYSNFAFVKRHDEFESIQLNNRETRDGDWGNIIFVHDSMYPQLAPILYEAAPRIDALLVDKAISFKIECQKRLRVIEELKKATDEQLQSIERLEGELETAEARRQASTSQPVTLETVPGQAKTIEARSAEVELSEVRELEPDLRRMAERLDQLQARADQNDKLYQRALDNAEAVAEARLRVIQVQERALGIHRRWDWREWRRRFFAPRLGVLYQYPPRPLEIPSRYREIQPLDAPPVISIVSPTFNQGKFVERTIKSVLGQKYPKLEYIIQDGGSSDETREVLERHKAYLSHYESVKDKGQANAINLGFRHSTGEIMAYLNSDDLLLPGTLNYVAHFFATHPEVDVVYGHRIVIDEYDEEMGRWVMPPHDNAILSWVDYIPQETLFWRRRMWQKAGGCVDESFRFAMDWDLLLRFRDAGATFVRLPRFLGAFRVHPHQKTSAQIEDVGIQEMNRLRELCHGRPVSPYEVARNSRSYLYRHVVYNKLWRLGVLRY